MKLQQFLLSLVIVIMAQIINAQTFNWITTVGGINSSQGISIDTDASEMFTPRDILVEQQVFRVQ